MKLFICYLLLLPIIVNAGVHIDFPRELIGDCLSSSLDPYFYDYNVTGRILHVKNACKGVSLEQQQEIESHQEDIIALNQSTAKNVAYSYIYSWIRQFLWI